MVVISILRIFFLNVSDVFWYECSGKQFIVLFCLPIGVFVYIISSNQLEVCLTSADGK